MSISSAINAARSGLQVTSLRADTVATNVANAGTAGYVRRSISISESITGGQTTGVRSSGYVRAGNEALSAERRSSLSDLSQSKILSTTWSSISTRVGDTADGGQLFKAFSEFETTLADAAQTPESTTHAASVLASANKVISEFNQLSLLAVDLRREADTEIGAGVDALNLALKNVEDLNGRIAASKPGSSANAALIDERQRELDTIAEYVPIQTAERHAGTIDVLTTEGVFLVAGAARKVEFSPSSAFGPEHTVGNGLLSGLTVDGLDITPGADTFGAISSGVLGALFQVRDEDAPGFSAQLDTLANDLVTRLSADSIDSTKTPGEQGFFVDSDPVAGAGIAARLQINAAIDPNQGGELRRLRDGIGSATAGPTGSTTILNNLSAAFTNVQPLNASGLNGSFSSTETIAHFSSIIGQTRISRDAVLTSSTTQYDALTQAEQSETGVDIDAQMQDLIFVEQAYAANARVIEVASQLMDILMEL
jgi:flagellar hook-associated protein 1 FlgK